jgi:hypothetical protein
MISGSPQSGYPDTVRISDLDKLSLNDGLICVFPHLPQKYNSPQKWSKVTL